MAKPKRPRDVNQLAATIVADATSEPEEEPCPDCGGAGVVEHEDWRGGVLRGKVELGCKACHGTGWRVVEAIPEETPAPPQRKGGLEGGKARAEKLSPERRREIAKKAAAARWGPRGNT